MYTRRSSPHRSSRRSRTCRGSLVRRGSRDGPLDHAVPRRGRSSLTTARSGIVPRAVHPSTRNTSTGGPSATAARPRRDQIHRRPGAALRSTESPIGSVKQRAGGTRRTERPAMTRLAHAATPSHEPRFGIILSTLRVRCWRAEKAGLRLTRSASPSCASSLDTSSDGARLFEQLRPAPDDGGFATVYNTLDALAARARRHRCVSGRRCDSTPTARRIIERRVRRLRQESWICPARPRRRGRLARAAEMSGFQIRSRRTNVSRSMRPLQLTETEATTMVKAQRLQDASELEGRLRRRNHGRPPPVLHFALGRGHRGLPGSPATSRGDRGRRGPNHAHGHLKVPRRSATRRQASPIGNTEKNLKGQHRGQRRTKYETMYPGMAKTGARGRLRRHRRWFETLARRKKPRGSLPEDARHAQGD